MAKNVFVLTCALLGASCATLRPADADRSIQPLLSAGGTCTAWSVAPAQWLTARHCITLGGREGWTIAGAPVSVLAVSPNADLAILSGPVAPSLSVAPSPPPIGASVLTFGYGMSRRDLLIFSGLIVSNASRFFEGATEDEMLISGANGLPGQSGGPVLWRGRVVGTISGGGTAQNHTHLIGSAVTWNHLRSFVRQHVR